MGDKVGGPLMKSTCLTPWLFAILANPSTPAAFENQQLKGARNFCPPVLLRTAFMASQKSFLQHMQRTCVHVHKQNKKDNQFSLLVHQVYLHDFLFALDRFLSLGTARWLGTCVADLTMRSMISSAASSVALGESSLPAFHEPTRPGKWNRQHAMIFYSTLFWWFRQVRACPNIL